MRAMFLKENVLKRCITAALRGFPAVLGALLVVVGLNAVRIGTLFKETGKAVPVKPKILTHDVAQGLSIQTGAYPGQKLLRFESCRIEKQRMGGFSFGAFNVLVIDQLEIRLPLGNSLDLLTGKRDEKDQKNDDAGTLAVKEELFKLLAQYPKFSAIRIHHLSVGCISQSGTHPGEVIHILTAGRVESGRGQQMLQLQDCEFLTAGGERIKSRRAALHLGGPIFITTKTGSYSLFGISDGHVGRYFKVAKNRKVKVH